MYKCELGGYGKENPVYQKVWVGVAPVTQCLQNDSQAKLHEMNQTERKMLLLDFLENENKEANEKEKGLIIQFDANARLGHEYINNNKN